MLRLVEVLAVLHLLAVAVAEDGGAVVGVDEYERDAYVSKFTTVDNYSSIGSLIPRA